MQTLLRIKTYVAILPIMLLMLLYSLPAYSEKPHITWDSSSGSKEQEICSGSDIDPIIFYFDGENVTGIKIDETRIKRIPDKNPSLYTGNGWGDIDLGSKLEVNSRTNNGIIYGTIRSLNYITYKKTGSVTYEIPIQTVGGSTTAEAIIKIRVHPFLDENQESLMNINCGEDANARILVMPGYNPGTPPYYGKTSDMSEWEPMNDSYYKQSYPTVDGELTEVYLDAYSYTIVDAEDLERIKNNGWELMIKDSNGCSNKQDFQVTITEKNLEPRQISDNGEYFETSEENCKGKITVYNANYWRFTDPGDPDNTTANNPIVYVLKKKNEDSGFEEIDRKWITADTKTITFTDLEAGTYAVSTAFYANPDDPNDKLWSDCTYDVPYGSTSGPLKKDVIISGAPQIFELTAPDGNTYCDEDSDSGADLQLSGSETDTSYQLYKDGTPIGSPIQGTGSAMNFGKQTEGLYTVIATKSGCTADMAGEITITKKDAPAAPVINIPNGGLSYCKGTDGAEVIVTNAVNGVTYTLYNVEESSETQVAQITATADGSLSLGMHTKGTYKVVATNDSQCSTERAEGNFPITELPLPEAPEIYGISADNSIGYCADDANGADITVSNPINNVTYTLYQKNGDDFTEVENSAIKYDGSNSVKWSATEGEYTVVATNASECSSANAEGTIKIKASPLPEKPGLTATYAACQNETGTKDLNELIHDKPGGYTVTWYDSNMVPLSDTNISLKDAGTQTFYATYTNASGCESEKATIDIVVGASSAVPVVTDYDECAEEGILDLNSLATLNRDGLHWFDSGMNPLDDTKTSIKKDEIGTSTYYVYNVDAGGCKSEQTEVDVTIRPVPAAPVINIPDGGLSYCKGTDGAEIVVTNAVNGVTYTLYMVESSSDTQIAQEIASTDGSLSFGKHTAGTYKVVATNDSQCSSERADGDLVITELPLPASIGLIAPDGNGYCDGDAGVELQLPTSEAGIEYTLEKDGTVIGTFTGSGSAVELGLYEAGEYFVAATNPASGCSIRSQSAFSVEIMGKSAAPNVNTDYVEDGTFEVCAGESQSTTLTTFVQNGEALNLTWYKDAGLTEIIPADEIDLDLSTEKDVTYYVTNTEDGLCESLPVLLHIVVNAVPSAPVAAEDPDNAGYAYSECASAGSKSLSELIVSHDGTLQWYDAAGNPLGTGASFDTSEAGETTYYASSISADGCESAKAEVKVRVLAAGVAPDVLDYNECAQEGTYNLDNLATTPQGTLEWFGDASATQLLSPATFDMAQVGNHTYYVRATASGECHSGVVPVSVVIRDVATASDISVDDLDVCPGAEATLTASTSMDDVNMVFTWYSDAELGNSIGTGATLQITGPEAQATYYVTVKGDNTCENLPGDAAEADVYAIAPIDNVMLEPVEERIGMGKETEKALTVEPTDAYYTAVWTANGQVIADPDSYFPAKPYSDVEYKVVVTDECGNEMEASAITKVVWPTIITPQNADGKNDDFLVGMQEDIHLEIFDRWGNVVFSGNDGWSQAEAAKQQPGVYYYIATLPDGTAKQGTIEVYK